MRWVKVIPVTALLLAFVGVGWWAKADDASSGPILFQGANVTTDASGNWTVNWAQPFADNQFIVHSKAVVSSGTQPITCEVATRPTSSQATGWCRQAATVTVSILGAVVNVFNAAPASGTVVMVNARDHTQ